MVFLMDLLVVLKAVNLIKNNKMVTKYRVQCTRCGKDITGWSDEDYQDHIRVHLMDEIRNKYPQVFQISKEIEAKYSAKMVFDFNE